VGQVFNLPRLTWQVQKFVWQVKNLPHGGNCLSLNEVFQIRRAAAIEQLRSDGWLANVEWYAEIDSTNNYLKRELTKTEALDLPRLVVADRQTSGRGRGENAWWSPAGCLMFSLAWRPKPHAKDVERDILLRISQLPLVIGVSIANTLRSLVLDRNAIRVKWPNDVFLAEKKLGGILIESIVGPGEPFWIIGVGINVEVDFADASELIKAKATSLHRECISEVRESLCAESILLAIVPELHATLDRWQQNDDFLRDTWPEYCLLHNRWVQVKTTNESLQGTCTGIDDRGALIMQDPSGRIHTVLSGVVESWK
jgi:BirA family transcriptional regulator, biotin operon repressor / biotin---[acetyl-CoA-carboxylase] ligase